ncbi:MAG: cytochrome b/b6 domain-containing protein, partial [Burkholderiales bacterium]
MSEISSEKRVVDVPPTGRVMRHAVIDRLYHWLMAIAVLTLMATAFLPILGWKFQWVEIHWISGLLLTALVGFHIVRALIWLDWRSMMIWMADARDICVNFRHTLIGGAAQPVRPGKYNALQKLYHLAVAILVLALIVTGLLMLLKIDTPFWRRDPYWFSNETWGLIYVIHDFAAMALVTLVMVHIYFALRPDEWYLTR